MTCPSPDYCDVNGCTNSACHPLRSEYHSAPLPMEKIEIRGGVFATRHQVWAAIPADPERYERPRGWGRQYIVAGAVAMALAALVVAYAALLPW